MVTPQSSASTASLASVRSPPSSIHVLGRSSERENADICGEYARVQSHQGRPAYRLCGGKTMIYNHPSASRWIINREGIQTSDVCVAYADDTDAISAAHPAHRRLIWNVWNASSNAHMPAPEILVLDAPSTLTVIGRASDRESNVVNGEYRIAGVEYGKPRYERLDGSIVLRYFSQEARWFLSEPRQSGNICIAFAEDPASLNIDVSHPGNMTLQWHFWDPKASKFLADPAVRVLTAPSRVHIVGRDVKDGRPGVSGTFHLAGYNEGRPIYVLPGTTSVLRYFAKNDVWLIDCDGLAEASLLSRLYSWVFSGSSASAEGQCSAFAEAKGTEHPAYLGLEWKLWDSHRNLHVTDPNVRATTAPLLVRVAGRESAQENNDICGDYLMVGIHLGAPAYRKSDGMTIRYAPSHQRWLIDREGLRDSDSCVAFADRSLGYHHPASGGSSCWHVFSSGAGRHLADLSLSVSIPPSGPQEVSDLLPSSKRQADDPNPAGATHMKRLRAAESQQQLLAGEAQKDSAKSWFGRFGA